MGRFQQYESKVPSAHQTGGSAEELIRSTTAIRAATSKATSAANSLNQEQVIAAANLTRQAVNDLLDITKTTAQRADNADLKYKMLNAGRNVALEVCPNFPENHSQVQQTLVKTLVNNAAEVASQTWGSRGRAGHNVFLQGDF